MGVCVCVRVCMSECECVSVCECVCMSECVCMCVVLPGSFVQEQISTRQSSVKG